MKTCGIFTTHRVEVDVRSGEPFKIIPFGDVHRDSDLHAADEWKGFLRYAKGQKKALFLGMGDYTDGVSTSERIALSGPDLHDTTRTTMRDVYKGVAKTLTNELSFMRGRLIGMLGGNHYFTFENNDTTDHVLAANLGTKFLGVCSFIRLALNVDNRKKITFDIFAHHGKGGGTLPGSTFNTLEKMATTAQADLYLMGHDHKKGCIPSSPRLTLVAGSNTRELSVLERTPWLGRTGSFLKAYEPGQVSYNVDAGRSPAALGWIEIEVTATRETKGGEDRVRLKVRGTS